MALKTPRESERESEGGREGERERERETGPLLELSLRSVRLGTKLPR